MSRPWHASRRKTTTVPWFGVLMFSVRRTVLLSVLLVAVAGILAAQNQPARVAPAASLVPFDYSETMRIDYFHTGGPGGEVLKLDRVVSDGPWPGSRTQLIDETNL